MMTLQELLTHFPNARKAGKYWRTNCTNPNHPDNDPSLDIYEGEDGRPHLKCRSSDCPDEAILSGVGLAPSDVWGRNGGGNNGHKTPKRERHSTAWLLANWNVIPYDYTDEHGNLVYQNVRFEDPAGIEKKRFTQRRPGRNGKWVYNLTGVTKTLYHLRNVLNARAHGTIYIVEGEKDVENAYAKLRITATCSSGGTGSGSEWERGLYSEHLRGACVVIIPDNDEPGRTFAQKVAKGLHGIAQEVRILDLVKEAESRPRAGLPVLPEQGDLSNWIELGGDAGTLKFLANEATIWTPEDDRLSVSNETLSEPKRSFHRTDTGNAERLVQRHGDNIRYCCDAGKWLVWDGTRWGESRRHEIRQLAKETVMSIFDELSSEPDPDIRKEIFKHAMSSEAASRIRAMLDLAQSEEGIPVTMDMLDQDPWLLNCLNGTIDLRTGELRQVAKPDLITLQVAVEYDLEAKCPKWESFLEKVLPDKDVRDYVKRAVGYTLTGDTSEQCLFFLFGKGKNGKTVFIETITSMVEEYHKKIDSKRLMVKQGDNIPNDVAALAGRRLVTTSEVYEGQRLDEGLIKDLTGGDRMTARFMRQEWFDFLPAFKLWMYGNHKPSIRGKDEGIWRRIKLIPFIVTIPPEERNKRLIPELREELPGILRWAVEGCREWLKDGLNEPAAVIKSTEKYRAEQDAMAEFIAQICTIQQAAKVAKKEMWRAYQAWCKATGEAGYDTQRKLNEDLRERPGIISGNGKGNIALWKGIGIRADITKVLPGFNEPEEVEEIEESQTEKPKENAGEGVNEVNEVNENSGSSFMRNSEVKLTGIPINPVNLINPEGEHHSGNNGHDDGSAGYLLRWGERNGWPALEISSGHRITSGEEAWRRFVENASQKDKDAAVRATYAVVDEQVTK